MSLSDRALLLRRTPFGESSLVAQVCTRSSGRVHVLAKGAYRPTSRYFSVLDLFDTLELEWTVPRGGGELAILVSGGVQARRRRIAEDLEAYRAGLAMLELTDLAARPGQPEPALFDRLEEGLDALAAGGAPANLALVVFELAFLQNLGLAPALEACAACGGSADPVTPRGDRAAFSAGAGGRLCRRCAEEARGSGRRVGTLPIDVLQTATLLAKRSKHSELAPGLDAEHLVHVRDFVERFLGFHLETLPKSQRGFLSVTNRNAPP